MTKIQDPRVLFAAERTLLAWNRTSLALIAFGFLIERSGLLIILLIPERENSTSMLLTFWGGLSFILLGTFSAIYSAKQYSSVLKTLNLFDVPEGYSTKWGMVVNGVVALLGFLLIVALYFGHKWNGLSA